MRSKHRGPIVAIFVLMGANLAAAPRDRVLTNETGRYLTGSGDVRYRHQTNRESAARFDQHLDFGDALRTFYASQATVRFTDRSEYLLRDLTDLEIVRDGRPARTNGFSLYLKQGAVYVASKGGPVSIPIETRHATGTAIGTEFLVAVNPQLNRTEVIMFDGEVELQNPQGNVTVRRRQYGIAENGLTPRVLNPLEAEAPVQWWIYYPGVIDPDEFALAPTERAALDGSWQAYREGALTEVVRRLPGAEPETDATRVYYAAVQLAAGSVEQALQNLRQVENSNSLPVLALRLLIHTLSPPLPPFLGPDPEPGRHAIDSGPGGGGGERLPGSASQIDFPPGDFEDTHSSSMLMAVSYAHQATNNLSAALAAARRAVEVSPHFAFGWARVAELEFNHGHTFAARHAVQEALAHGPANAQAVALHGFLLAAQGHTRGALGAFNRAIELDPTLANAWLGRGLCQRRLSLQHPFRRFTPRAGEPEPAWISDLRTAAILEPRRSLLRSYAGKAFGEIGHFSLAEKELSYARQLDPGDPTPWLYSALLKREQNRNNEAVAEAEESIRRNQNRAVYRSRFLLDQDRAVRSSSRANIYQSVGLNEVALAEAARSISYDYANHSAHQFAAESYDALRDPTRFNLRYETVWFNELLLANLLSPVGATPLSQHISQQEYTRLFDHQRVGLISDSSYRSDGQYRELASQFGVLGNTAWSLDLDYQHNNGVRPNNQLDRIEWYSTIKHQLNARDSFLLMTKYQDYRAGDNLQHFAWKSTVRTNFQFIEHQAPIAMVGLHREWSPQSHTLFLGGRVENDQRFTDQNADRSVLPPLAPGNEPQAIRPVYKIGFDYVHRIQATIYFTELQHLYEDDRLMLLLGGRWQAGDFASKSVLSNPSAFSGHFPRPVGNSNVVDFAAWDTEFERVTAYAYHTWKLPGDLRLTGGASMEHMRYPANFRDSPLSGGEEHRERVTPKAAAIWEPQPGWVLRASYAESLGGVTLDESYRLEPTQLAGFPHDFRSVIPESMAGSVSAPDHRSLAAALDARPARNLFVTLAGGSLGARASSDIGVFEDDLNSSDPVTMRPSTTRRRLDYDERWTSFHAGYLLEKSWQFGLGYTFSDVDWRVRYPWTPEAPITQTARLHRLRPWIGYAHACGLFGQIADEWIVQESSEAPSRVESVHLLGAQVGYRLPRQRGEILVGALNLAGQRGRFSPLTTMPEPPHERVFYVRVRFRF